MPRMKWALFLSVIFNIIAHMQPKKKICIDIRMAFHSGIGTYIRNLLPYIQKSELSLQVLAPLSHLEKWPELQTYDIIPFEAPIYSIREQLEMPIKIPACDVFWSTHYNIPLAPIRAKRRLASIHDVNHLAHGASLGLLKRSYAKIMLNKAAHLADHVMTISQFSKNEIIKWTSLDEKKITVSHLAVDASRFSLVRENNVLQEVKRIYNLPDNYILYVGNLAFHKNLTRLLQAWQLVQLKHSNYKLVLAGKEDLKKSLEGTISQNPVLKSSVIRLGIVEQSHLPLLYQLATGFIFPSLYEGFGLPPLESMRMQCPTIVSTAASLPEVCQEASIYVDPYNVDDMAQKMCQLIEDPLLRQSLVDKGLEHINKYSWEKTALAHLEVIRRLLA